MSYFRFLPALAAVLIVVACSSPAAIPLPSQAAQPPVTQDGTALPPAPVQPSSSGAVESGVAPAAPAVASAAGGAPPAPAAEAPAACPADMVLVAGDYCSEVEHKCLSQWYAQSNKKDICERFEPTSRCVGTRTPKRFCIDRYDWPNVAGERPEVMNNFYQAQVKCAAIGRRLCTESEWTMSCEGPDLLPFPYGYERDTNKCNGDREWDAPNMTKVAQRDPGELARLWQGVPNGSQPFCVSGYGVPDLPGNSDEVVSSENTATNFRGLYDSATTGGPWYKGVRNQCRPKIYTHNEGFYYYYLSFRCCAEADGGVTDPRAPKQIARKWDFLQVERLAGFSRAQMQEKLELKREGKCNCPTDGKLCKTMCGTLLGSQTKDVQLGEPKSEANPPAHLRSVSTKQH